MLSPRWTTVLAILALFGSYTGAIGLGVSLDPGLPDAKAEVMALPSPPVVKLLSLGFETTVADLYFLRAANYFGNPENYRAHYEYLYPLLELVSELDRRWPDPVLWGGIAVQRNLGRETWINTAESTRLLEKGARRFPHDYRFHLYLAYNLSTFSRDTEAAAKQLEKAVGLPGTPDYVPRLVTRLYSSAGELESARIFAEGMIEDTADPDVRASLQERLIDIETERLLRELDEAIDTHTVKEGRPPERIEQLVESGVLDGLPVEPRGGDWYIDHGSARSTRMPARLSVHRVNPRAP